MQDSKESLSIIDLLYNHFLPEKFHAEGNNQYFWNTWQKQVESAIWVQKLSKDVPPIIMITLNRFYYDRVSQAMKKRLDPIALSYSISISREFIEEDEESKIENQDSNSEIIYDLYAIIIHSGVSTNSGHYYTIAKDDINAKEKTVWKSYNDSMVSDVDEDFILTISKKWKYDTPYILFFKRREIDTITNQLPLEQREELSTKQTAKEENTINADAHISEEVNEELKTTSRQFTKTISLIDESGKLNIPESLKKFIESDNESYLKEKELISIRMNKNQYNSKDFNFALLKELQKHLMRNNEKGFDDARTMGPGGFGGYGNNSNFFGGDGGVW